MLPVAISPANRERMNLKVAWNHPFWFFSILTTGDFLLTMVGAIRFGSFSELNPLAFGAFETGAYWLPFSIKAASILGVYVVLMTTRSAGLEHHFRKVLWAFAGLFLTVNILSSVQIIMG